MSLTPHTTVNTGTSGRSLRRTPRTHHYLPAWLGHEGYIRKENIGRPRVEEDRKSAQRCHGINVPNVSDLQSQKGPDELSSSSLSSLLMSEPLEECVERAKPGRPGDKRMDVRMSQSSLWKEMMRSSG
ncbi:hypothetical protein EYF80_014762 [Liparis tanakae]|uniref:Uncharacterized protein n=1 Tax=Liparis tanakae TaxID=230148 RepID=A0A4Z2IAG2_9TELE|nr:hypothetical protein EYF80_014762 [Liparis tanakae]